MPDNDSLRPGDVLRIPQLGHAVANPGHDLVVLFLGACRLDQEPVVPEYLRSIGFSRTHVFEVTLYWKEWEAGECAPINVQEYSSSLMTTAGAPHEAVEGAVRYAQTLLEKTMAKSSLGGRDVSLRGLSVALTRLGPIGPDGAPTSSRGRTFASWSADSGLPLEALLERAAEPA
jgi:hypothetical protein